MQFICSSTKMSSFALTNGRADSSLNRCVLFLLILYGISKNRMVVIYNENVDSEHD